MATIIEIKNDIYSKLYLIEKKGPVELKNGPPASNNIRYHRFKIFKFALYFRSTTSISTASLRFSEKLSTTPALHHRFDSFFYFTNEIKDFSHNLILILINLVIILIKFGLIVLLDSLN